MQTQIESIDPVRKRIKIEIPADEVNSVFDHTVQKYIKKSQVRGFRPGKAPRHIVQKAYRPEINMDVIDKLVQETLFSALKEAKEQPIGMPVLEEITEIPQKDRAFVYSATYEILPELDLEKIKQLNIDRPEAKIISDADVEAELKKMQRDAEKQQKADDGTPLSNQHIVAADLETFDSEIDKKIEQLSGHYELDMREPDPVLDPLKSQMLGHVVGDTVEATLQLPEDFAYQDLRGKTVHVKATIKEITNIVTPAIDDEFAKDHEFETLQELKDHIKNLLVSNAQVAYWDNALKSIIEKAREAQAIVVPSAAVDYFIDTLIERQVRNDQVDKLKSNTKIRDVFRQEAEFQAACTILFGSIEKSLGLDREESISKEEIDAQVNKDLKSYQKFLEKLGDEEKEHFMEQLKSKARKDLITNRCYEWLLDALSVPPYPA